MRLFKKKHPYTKQITITPPRPDADRAGIAIVTCVKNEARYIAEWIEFHRSVGVAHFYIYDDGSDDGTVEVARKMLEPSALTVIPWKGRMIDARTESMLNTQAVAFAHGILNFGSRYARMAFIDVDEFLLPKKGDTLEEALEGSKGFPNISLPWHMFGTSGHKTRPPGYVLRNYTVRAEDPMSGLKNASNFKCIVDPCEVSEVSIHHFSTRGFDENTSNDRGEVFSRRGRKGKEFYSSQFIQLNHYYTKSEEDLREKLEKGSVAPGSRERRDTHILTGSRNIEMQTIVDTAMTEFLDRKGLFLS